METTTVSISVEEEAKIFLDSQLWPSIRDASTKLNHGRISSDYLVYGFHIGAPMGVAFWPIVKKEVRDIVVQLLRDMGFAIGYYLLNPEAIVIDLKGGVGMIDEWYNPIPPKPFKNPFSPI